MLDQSVPDACPDGKNRPAEAHRRGSTNSLAAWWRGRAAGTAYVVIGAVFGLLVSLASTHRGTQPWAVWACLAIGLAAASGAVFGFGLSRWPEIVAWGAIRITRVVGIVLRVVLVGLAMLVIGGVLTAVTGRDPVGRHDGDLLGLLLVLFAGLGALPVGAGLAAVHEQARALPGTAGEQVEAILALRRQLSGLLNALGVLVALATLALGAGLQAGDHPGTAVVVVFGAAWSLIVALAYAPAAGALRDAARALSRAVVPLTNVTPADLPARLEDRHRLEVTLGADRSLLSDLQSGVIILAPLLASGATVFLPG